MVYKKYIKRDGKLFGPYYYESHRDKNGRVITQYISRENPKPKQKSEFFSKMNYAFFVSAGILLFLLLSIVLYDFFYSTGLVTLDIRSTYFEGEQLKGVINLNLKSGELIPKDTKLILNLGSQEKEFYLSDILGENTVSGDYYAENIELSGSGEGYGIAGGKKVYPEVDFDLLISNEAQEESTNETQETGENETTPTETPEETIPEEIPTEEPTTPETPTETPTEETTPTETPEETIPEEIPTEEPTTPETPTETPTEETTSETTSETDTSESSSDSSSSESSSSSDSSSSDSSSSDSGSSESSSSDSSSSSGDSGSSGAGESGGITGAAISENEFVVHGTISEGNEFSYNLEEGQTASIVSGSVKINGTEVSDLNVELEESNNQVIVKTDYYIIEGGFGKDYSGDETISIPIEIDPLDITVENATLDITLKYENSIITEMSKEIKVIPATNITQNETELNETIIPLMNETEINQTNITLTNETILNITSNIFLIKDIPSIRMQQNENVSLDLTEYFEGAETYEATIINITAIIENQSITFIPDLDFKGARKGKIIAIAGNETLESNEFNILVSSGAVRITTTKSDITLGERVKWTSNISLDVAENVTIELPASAENITVLSVENNEDVSTNSFMTGNVVMDVKIKKKSILFFWWQELSRRLTGKVTLEADIPGQPAEEIGTQSLEIPAEENVTEYVVEYYTEAPVAVEKDISSGKEVVISAPSELNYTDVLSFTNIPEMFNVGEESKIKILWKENNSYIPFDAYDMDGNDKLDYVEWITPHLSNQTFWIIFITKAEHLDENRTFVEDVYDYVKARDNNFTLIPSGDYLRVTFEQTLNNEKDITLYARASTNASIEVYEKDGNEKIATFENVEQDKEYKVYLTSLVGEQDVFDLKFLGDVEVDYVVDPSGTAITNCTELQNINKTGVSYLANDINCTYDTRDPSGGLYNAGLGFLPISTFTGSLDGQGYTIYGLYTNRSAIVWVGLFGDMRGNITNVNMREANIASSYVGTSGTGILVGVSQLGGIIDNCSVQGDVSGVYRVGGLIGAIGATSLKVTNSKAIDINVIGIGASNYVGGFVGQTLGYIANCSATGNVSGGGIEYGGFAGRTSTNITDNCFANTIVNNTQNYTGGFVGHHISGLINNSYAWGQVYGGKIYTGGFVGRISLSLSNSYTTSDVNGETYVGGFSGYIGAGSVSDSYSTGSITNTTSTFVAGFIGRNLVTNGTLNVYWNNITGLICFGGAGTGTCTAIQNNLPYFYDSTNAPMSSWDFVNTWQEVAGDYPRLAWEVLGGGGGDTTAPNLTIISPENKTYNTKNILINLTNSSDTQAVWWYNGTANITYTGEVYFNFSEGSNIFYAYANDSTGNINSSSVTFNIDSISNINITSPLNNSEVIRGKDAGTAEDDSGRVSGTLTVKAFVFKNSSLEGISNVNCSFYWNESFIGSNLTNSSGNCILTFDKTSYNGAIYPLKVNYSLIEGYDASSMLETTNSVNLSVISMPNLVNNIRTGSQYMIGDAAILKFNVTKNGVLFDPSQITVNVTRSNLAIVASYSYPGSANIVRLGEGQYYSKTIVNSTFETAMRWDLASLDSNGNYISTVVEADKEVIPATGKINVSIVNSSNSLQSFNYTLYDTAGYVLENISVSDSFDRAAATGDKYKLVMEKENLTFVLNDFNETANSSIQINHIVDYSYSIPAGIKSISDVVALNETGFSFSKASITLQKNGMNISKICHCTQWSFASSNCSSWECNLTSDYEYGEDENSFTFNVTSFTGYAGGEGYSSNLTIWDSNDSEGGSNTISTGQQANFYANYTAGAVITGAECNFTENSSGSWSSAVSMTYNATSLLYEYNKSFSSAGTFNWNVTCLGNSSYDSLTANDTIIISEEAGLACGATITSTTTLTANLTCEGDALIIGADNVVINGAGFTVTGNINASKSGDRAYTGLNISNAVVVGDVLAVGADNADDAAFAGGNVLISNSTIATITTSGGAGSGNGGIAGASGAVTIINSNITAITASGASSSMEAGVTGGTIDVTNSTIITINTTGGSSNGLGSGGAGGNVTVSDSSISNIITSYGEGLSSGGALGGAVTVSNSNITTITTGFGSGPFYDGIGGAVTVTNSNVTTIKADGGTGSFSGGNITIINSSITTISTKGGDTDGTMVAGGRGGSVTITNSNATTITTTGGMGAMLMGGDSIGGSVTVTNSNITTIIAKGGTVIPATGGASGSGGAINISNSNIVSITASAGDGGQGAEDGSNGGSVIITNSNITTIISAGGDGMTGGDGGNVSILDGVISLSGLINITGGLGDPIGVDGTLIFNQSSLSNTNGSIKFSYLSTKNITFALILSLGNNSAYVNSSNYADYNVSANITLKDIGERGYTTPTILKDGVACGSSCSNFTALNAETVIFNVTSWSNYSVGEGADLTAPLWSNQITKYESGTTYSPSKQYQFNITWTDETGMGSVWLEHNFTGAFVNYSASGNISSNYYYNYTGIAAGNYSYKWYANDTSGNINSTDYYSYVVLPMSGGGALTLEASPNWTVEAGNQSNVSCYSSNSEHNVTLWRNNVLAGSSQGGTAADVQTLAVGSYNYTCNASATQNYTAGTTSNILIVNDTIAPTCVLLSRTPGDINDNSSGILSVIINCTDPSGINVTKTGDHYAFFITRTVDAFILAPGIPNYWSNRYPNNSLGVIGSLTPPYKIWRALGRNEGYWYDSLTNTNLTDCTGKSPCYAPLNDTFSYAIEDGDYGHFTVTNTSTNAIINYTHPAVSIAAFRQSVYLSYESMVKEAKKNYTINLNNYLLMKRFDAEAYRGTQNYTMNVYRNFGVVGSPSKTLRAFYCNISYNPAGGTKVINSPNCALIGSLLPANLNNIYFTDKNSSYSKGTYAITNGKFGGIIATAEFYIEYESPENGGGKYYQLKYVNEATNTDVAFNNTKVAWTTTNGGASWTQALFTPDVFTTSVRSTNDEFQFGAYVTDNYGHAYMNFTMIQDAITLTNHPISSPLVLEYNSTPLSLDDNLNGTHKGIMNVRIGVSKDPDSVGNVTHNLTLRNLDGTLNYTINGSFLAPLDAPIWINFNTSLVPDGKYRMNIWARSGDDISDMENRTTDRNFTIDNTNPMINFTVPTEISGSTIVAENVLVNVTVNDANLANITIRLYNSTHDLINETTSVSSPNFANFSTPYAFQGNNLYYFNATACDTAANCNSTETRNVTIEAMISISLPISLIDFGNISQGQNLVNLTGLHLQNDGNTYLSIDINATDIWQGTHAWPGDNYMYKIGDAGEGTIGTFSLSSLTSWTQVSYANVTAIFGLNWTDTNDTAAIQFNITVPNDEPAGAKESIIYLVAGEYVPL